MYNDQEHSDKSIIMSRKIKLDVDTFFISALHELYIYLLIHVWKEISKELSLNRSMKGTIAVNYYYWLNNYNQKLPF